jgi:hypothetical protein
MDLKRNKKSTRIRKKGAIVMSILAQKPVFWGSVM